ncbi:hypothetical protein CEB3_c44080 [Peptococcaceae bacterium CEB3]|nr:hypothetical protein CEB3_c44080 [Peptococcaceae bacterium CEB3]
MESAYRLIRKSGCRAWESLRNATATGDSDGAMGMFREKTQTGLTPTRHFKRSASFFFALSEKTPFSENASLTPQARK